MAAISISFVDKMKFEAKIRKHTMTIDVPEDLKGTDSGPMPPELFVLSLASCMGYYVLFYCRKNGIPVEGLKIDADFEKAKDPDRVSKIDIKFHVGNVSEEHKQGMIKIAEKCIVHQSIIHKPVINISVG